MTTEAHRHSLEKYLARRRRHRITAARLYAIQNPKPARQPRPKRIDYRADLPSLAQLIAEGERVSVLTRHQEARHKAQRWAA